MSVKWTKEEEAEYNSLGVPKDTLGVHKLYEPEHAKPDIDVVAVHGLGGDAFSTWTDNGFLWLRDALPKSPDFKNARILTFGYDARPFIKPFGNFTTGRIFTFGEEMLSAVADWRVRDKNRPLIFIGHSLGGIIIKSALVLAQTRPAMYGSLLSATKAIYFFGTPHQGADAATWATLIDTVSKAIGIRSATVTKELARWSNALVDLTVTFSGQADRFQIVTYFEKQKTYGTLVRTFHNWLGSAILHADWKEKVVSEASATLGQPNEVRQGLDANHLSICKFDSLRSANCEKVIRSFEATKYKIENLQEIIRETQIETLKNLNVPPQTVDTSDQVLEKRMQALYGKN